MRQVNFSAKRSLSSLALRANMRGEQLGLELPFDADFRFLSLCERNGARHRYSDGEFRAPAQFTLRFNPPLVSLDDFFGSRQSEAASPRVRREERAKYLRQHFGTNSFPGIDQ